MENVEKNKVGLLFNTQKPEAIDMAWRLWRWGKSNNIKFLLPPHEASAIALPGVDDEKWREESSFAVILGGDGTFLRAARYTFGCAVPLYGINLGRLGFLAIGSPESAENDIEEIISGKYSVQLRRLLKGQVWRGNRLVHELYALNDLVISKGSLARVVDIEVRVGKEILSLFLADGLILSTPTGSTAYALSAGGPIVPPHVPCMIMAPICAHTLYARPVILSDTDNICVIPKGDARNLMLTQDGQLGYELLPGDELHVMLDNQTFVRTIQLTGRSYYDLLREKLRWGFNGIREAGD
ncbi:NAD(+)/NADH kinase [Synergistes jonesii]|uniref:NAD kinase n=1 Tax=Synergistes jonesii TaxID=2754 RepID=A0A073IPC4_9BACT|nr:NAD(+)/NADH kinase [Synergistes jonesii]KEJ91341.1 ATP-NAD kinase [Synergistes jonesii]OFB60409.1 ATP-NAD kinase [Synergistes jonesii]OFB61234.1 ATP-NAD kinase [Synergistes jonesii]OFB62883.1 ATP-NAD kinase [Synergistes jonesii]OFB66620.1 ATP-NAD kinase [Synergistes jonesii]